MKKKLKSDSPLRAAAGSPSSDTDAAFDALKSINMGSTLPEMMEALEKAHALGRAKFEALERERDAYRDALKQIVHNPGWQDSEVGFMSGHIAAAVLNQFPENVKEHATLSAGANVDHGVEVETTGDHVNRAADRGCCVSTCCASSINCSGEC